MNIVIISSNIGCRVLLNRCFLSRGQLRLQLLGNSLRDLTLNREYIRKIAIISLSPYMTVGARINQPRVDAHAIAGALNASFHNVRDAELLGDLEQISRDSPLVLHH